MGVILLCDDFAGFIKSINPNVKIVCLSEVGYFIDYDNYKYD